jgi:hypothetical protein
MTRPQLRRAVTAAAIAGCTIVMVAPTSAEAQIRYGPWQRTSDCRSAPSTVGPGGDRIRLPQAPGGSGTPACRWERAVEDCPRIRDRVLHPIRCTTRRQRSGYSATPPLD